ncbi:MAG: cobalamin-binding protein [Acidobacteriota bacterium]
MDFGLKNSNYKLAFLITFAVIAAFGCRGVEVSSPVLETREVNDDLGRTVRVPVKLDRAISLAPSLTEMIFAIGAGDRLVGVTTYCNYPAETASIEKIGDTQTPNIEKIIALRPQIVFVSTASQLEAFTKTLEDQGIAVYVSNAKSLDEVFQSLLHLGELFGTKGKAEELVSNLNGRADQAEHVHTLDEPTAERKNFTRVFVQISNDPLFTIGRDSFLTELVAQAGGISVTNDVPTAYPKLSKESAAAMNPDVIFLSDSEDNREASSVFKDSGAVKNGRVYRINADIISRPGPRLVDALEEIALRLEEKK